MNKFFADLERKGLSFKNLLFLVFSFSLLVYFQNCANPHLVNLSGSSDLASGALPINHAAPVEKILPSDQKIVLAHRGYIEALLREVFTSPNHSIHHPKAGSLDDILEHWIIFRGTQFGLACNPYGSYTTADCGGDVSSANGSLLQDDGTLRESFRLQACRQILDSENSVEAALENLNLSIVAPDRQKIMGSYEIFYRDTSLNLSTLNSLLALDKALASAGESDRERWRAILLLICESPGWQQL